jgi:hypothetical protein
MQRDLVRDEPLRLAQPVWEQLDNFHHHQPPRELGAKSYFCAPYHAWEKGLVENHNGLLRQYYPYISPSTLPIRKPIGPVMINLKMKNIILRKAILTTTIVVLLLGGR